jgi:glyoxylase-like metal-dependent hydrolase (beta-lactamase superfamily II)
MPELDESFCFDLGDFKCQVIKDGTIMTPGKNGEPEPIMDVSCLLVKTEKHIVLIDSGFGEHPVIDGIKQEKVGKTLEILKKEGIKASGIDTIILSHLHPDHIGGITDDAGKAVFPNAKCFVYQKEWNFWMNSPDLSQLNINFKDSVLKALEKRIQPIRDKFNPIEEIEIVPGIKLIESAGHTPGHVTLSISSGSQQLVCIFDLLHSYLEFSQPDLFISSDMLPDQAFKSRREVFSRIAESGALVFASHFSFPGLGYVTKQGSEYSWMPFNERQGKC